VTSESPRLRAFLALCLARLKETYREPEVLFWGFVFPLLLSGVLALAFRSRGPEAARAVVLEAPGAPAVARALAGARLVEVRTAAEEEAARDLRMGRADVIVVPPSTPGGPVALRFDPTRPEAGVARARIDDALQRAAGRVDPVRTEERVVDEPGGRYVDFLVPGLVGMNLMNAGLWGVGYMLVDMRIKKLLKRLLATPMRRADFLLAQMTNRVAFTLVEVGFLLAFGHFVLGVPVHGSLPAIAFLAIAGSLCFAGLGLLIACRAQKIETVNGLMNLLILPMWAGSGVFFSIERFPAAVQKALQLLPLTALIDALRAVTLEGAPVAAQGPRLLVLAAWGAVSFLVGLRLFRWS
jgi:ABC-type multidrug transport system permease subunit